MKISTNQLLKISAAIVTLSLAGCATSVNPTHDADFSPVRAVSSKPLPIHTGSIYLEGYEVALFEDTKARHVGDILTVVLQENTNASKSASTSTTKDSEIGIPVPTILGGSVTKNGVPILNMDVESNRSFTGEGDSSQSNSLRGMVSVTITELLPNGNLMIRGEKLLTLNQGVEHIRLSGIIRANDIAPDNTIPSAKIANAKIIYAGDGSIAESNTKGWFQRLVDGPYWPF